MSIEFYVVDTETTGLSSSFHEVIEISVIRVRDKLQISRQIKAENPKNASLDALKICNKTMADLYKGISKEQAVNDVNNFFNLDGLDYNHRCIVGHNIITFDKKFLHPMWARFDKRFPADMFCDTMQMMRALVKQKQLGKQKVNLHASCDLMGIKKIAEIHTAKHDSRNNYLLWKKLIDEDFDYLPFIKQYPHIIENQEENMNNLIEIE